VAVEIVQTEKSYLDGLRIGVDIFMKRLSIHVELDKPIISIDDITIIFNNLDALRTLSEKLYHDLEEIKAEKEIFVDQIGLTLLHYAPYFRPYQQYLEGYDTAINRLYDVRKINPDFDFFLKVHEKAEGVNLDSCLIQPVQRLPRYLLLLKELKKQTPTSVDQTQMQHVEDPRQLRADLTEAEEHISRIAAAINNSLRARDDTDKIEEIAAIFEKDDRYMDLVKPGRKLIRDGMLSKAFSKVSKHMGKYKKYHFFLFNDVLVYADEVHSKLGQKKYKMKHVLYLDSLMVTKNTEKLNNRINVIMTEKQVSRGKGNDFLLKARDQKERDQWFQDFDGAIQARKSAGAITLENFDGRKSAAAGQMKNSKMAALLGMDQ